MIDVPRVRIDTPGCKNVLHFNNAGSSLMPTAVTEAVISHIRLESEIGGYEAAEKKADDLENTYVSVARLLGCTANEVAIVENATRGWDMAFYAIKFQPGDRILTGRSEYASNYIAFLQMAKRCGVRIEVIPNDETGQISIKLLERALERPAKLIAITHVPTNGGLVNPAAEIGRVAKDSGAIYLLDACQSLGQMPLNVSDLGCHILTGTGRKFLRGPRGTGLMFVKSDLIEQLEPPFLDLHAARWIAENSFEIRRDAKRFENWESNMAGKLGLKIAIDYMQNLGADAIWRRISELSAKLRNKLGLINKVKVHDQGKTKCGIVTFTLDHIHAEDVKLWLQRKMMNVSVSLLEYARLDLESRGLPALVRASVHYYNTDEEIESFCEAIEELSTRGPIT